MRGRGVEIRYFVLTMPHDSFSCQETLTAYTLCCTTDQCNRCGLPETLPLDQQYLVPRPPGCPPIPPPSMVPAATPTETIGSTPIAGKCRKGKDCFFERSIELLCNEYNCIHLLIKSIINQYLHEYFISHVIGPQTSIFPCTH